ncbi:MAG: CysZ protein [Saprospiraceae bacterium]|jgi:CysZ protein
MITNFIAGFTSYFGAFNFVIKHRLYKHLIISGLISLIVGTLIIVTSYGVSDNISDFLVSFYPWEWGADYVKTFLEYVSGGLVLVIGFLLFKYILLVLISPFMGPLSAKVETIITNRDKKSKFSIKQISYEMIRGLRIASRNITREILITLFLLLLSFIPLITVFITPVIFLVQAYFAGFSNFDYFLERRTSVSQSVRYIKQHRWQVIGNGSAFLLLLLIPIVGLFFAPVLGTIAATRIAIKNNDTPDVI